MIERGAQRAQAGHLGVAVILASVIAVLSAGCAATTRTTFPPLGSTPGRAGDATSATVRQVTSALGAVGLQALEANRAFRPSEGPLLAALPRTVLSIALPDKPEPGFVVVYAAGSPEAATSAAQDHARYLASNTGGIVLPPGTHIVLRLLGSTVVFFTWLPGGSPDPQLQQVEDTLRAIGTEVQVPS
jgi:hypothetical protein